MTLSVSFTPAARSETINAHDWYEARAAGLGGAFQNEVERQIARIVENPLQFPEMIDGVRRARLQRFPYSLFFKIEAEGVFVIACFHASRDPQEWKGRA